jgi:hypothetical protein
LLVTADAYFGELLLRKGLRGHGVILLRLEGIAPGDAIAQIGALTSTGTELAGHLLEIDRTKQCLR